VGLRETHPEFIATLYSNLPDGEVSNAFANDDSYYVENEFSAGGRCLSFYSLWIG